MDIIIRNLHEQATEKEVKSFFREKLEKLGVFTFALNKPKGRLAYLTIHDMTKAAYFMYTHGQILEGARGHKSVRQKLYWMGKPINCLKSRNEPDQYVLLSLKKEESERYAKTQSQKPRIVPGRFDGPDDPKEDQRAFTIGHYMCGQWTYSHDDLRFVAYFQEKRSGRIVFGDRILRINLRYISAEMPSHQIDIPYGSVHSFTIGSKPSSCLTLSLTEAPKFYEKLPEQIVDVRKPELVHLLGNLNLSKPDQPYKRKRIPAINQLHSNVASSCLCYRFVLSNANEIAGVQALKRLANVPDSTTWNTRAVLSKISFVDSMAELNVLLAGPQYTRMPFNIKFQIQKLAQNGYLEPSMVKQLLQAVHRQVKAKKDTEHVAISIQKLGVNVPFAGPETEASELNLQALSDCLVSSQESISRGQLYTNTFAKDYDHIASIHKVMVTPAGIYLMGPEPEVKNRVLRKYSAFVDYFLSVSFQDEDGQSLRFDRQTSAEEIYHGHFKHILRNGISIAGRQYEFLGFSHSSLREQTCWFMAPFVMDGSLTYAKLVIQNLGDFSSIKSPAKCAARIGQAFSQTLSSVAITSEAFSRIPDIERNGRTFSDGVGTCSIDVLRNIWQKFGQREVLKPTVLQIRFQGAKGVISLDSRLHGETLRLRPSMIKFEVSNTSAANIEICGAALKPLPMKLNRQLIKILEDLHVPEKAFLRLQAAEVEKLRMTTRSSINAASFLQRNFIGKAASLPWLIRKLSGIGFSFVDDDFLRNTLEFAVLVQLRELKYRSRILIENGVTLYGIMDETGYLQESEIYAFVQTESGGRLLTGNVTITRSPALHPGDIQCVTAVNVPQDSPLRPLHNVVVFSSKGNRDLPSQLSGGDLDGDLYNIIYDDSLYPRRLAHPADYPTPTPIDIGRMVERSDMTDFFVHFMENDKLGLIATLHQILADQREMGTFDPSCILLAGLHSTAVDFSKTGIPVNFKEMPKWPRARPDFQAPGPRVFIDKAVDFEKEDDDLDIPADNANDELDEVASYEPPGVRYYESAKVLGKLYRQIDEREFFEEIQKHSRHAKTLISTTNSLADAVWNYANTKTAIIQWQHWVEFAKDTKDNYEDNLIDTMLQYSPHPSHFISEVEVFSGNILGKNGAQSKRQREFSKTMKEKHERDIEYTIQRITREDDGKKSPESLERSIACLYIACNTARVRKRVGELKSFVWIAAAVCLKEVEKMGDLYAM